MLTFIFRYDLRAVFLSEIVTMAPAVAAVELLIVQGIWLCSSVGKTDIFIRWALISKWSIHTFLPFFRAGVSTIYKTDNVHNVQSRSPLVFLTKPVFDGSFLQTNYRARFKYITASNV